MLAFDDVVRRFASSEHVVVALDFDGVLSPLVSHPDEARMLPGSAAAIATLARMPHVTLALISGRSLADLISVARPPLGIDLIGSHGAEIAGREQGPLTPVQQEALARAEALIKRVVQTHPETHLEIKPTAVALHTRRAERDVAQSATAAVFDEASLWPDVSVGLGKEIIEIFCARADKGTALMHLRERVPAGPALFLGDDRTDEQAFATLVEADGDIGVKVGEGPTVAPYRLDGPEAVADFLSTLTELLQR